MVPWFKLVWPVVLLTCCAVLVQGLLSDLKFSSVRAETVFRVLFLVPVLVDGAVMLRRGRQLGAADGWRVGIMSIPVVLVLVLTWTTLRQPDAQGALFLFMLPFIHGLFSLALGFVSWRWPARR